MPDATTISLPEYQAAAQKNEWRQLVGSQEPFVVRGGASDWPASSSWSVEHFSQLFGNTEYDCQVGLPTGVPTLHKASDFTRRVPFREFEKILAEAEYDSPCYLHQRPISQFPGLEKDVDFVSMTGISEKNPFINMWIGSAGTKSSLHFDFQWGLLAQIRGAKRFFLVDPKYSSDLALIPGVIQKSQVDPEDPDTRRYPRFAKVPVFETVVEEGDVIHIPVGWWHAVRGLSDSISVNYFFGPHMGAFQRMKYVLAAGPSTWFAVVKDFFKHGLFGVKLPGRLYSAEPFGVWFYNESVGFLRRRRLLPGKK